MNTRLLAPLLAAAALATAHAQVANSPYTIKKITPELLDSPSINAGSYRKSPGPAARKAKWLEVDVEFERESAERDAKARNADFADNVTVNYYILLNNASDTEDGKPVLLTGSVTHVDVPADKGLHSSAYVSPSTLNRLFRGSPPTSLSQVAIDVGVTISDSSGLVAIDTLKGTVKGDQGWWDDTTKLTPLPGRVLDKNNTPFASLAWDYYLPLRSTPGGG